MIKLYSKINCGLAPGKFSARNIVTCLPCLVWCLILVFFFVSVNSYGQVETVSSPSHTFFLGKLDLAVN